MRGEKVVALPGFAVPTPKGEPVRPVVEMLKEFLAKAEAGHLRSVAVAGVMVTDPVSAPNVETDFSSSQHSWALDAAIGRLERQFHKFLDE